MADYHPLIARAIAGLDRNTGENRRALYERARTALVAQLRGVQPALDESEITRERLALEEAIRKVEAEAARHARETARPTVLKRVETARREDVAPAAPVAARSGQAGAEPRPRPAGQPAAPGVQRAPGPAAPAPVQPAPPGLSQPMRPSGMGRRTLSDEGIRGFRRGVNDPPPRRADAFDPASLAEPSLPPAPSIPPPGGPGEPNPLEEYGQLEPQVQADNLWALPLDGTAAPVPTDFDEAAGRTMLPPEEELQEPLPPRGPQPPRSYSGVIRTALTLILVLAVGSLLYWQRGAIGSAASGIMALLRSSGAPPQREATTPAQPKITDRVGQPTTAPTQPSTAVPVAQRVVLYEEDPQDPQGKRYIGNVLWRTETKAAGPGRPPELAVRGDINIPERNMTVTWSLRRNIDQSLPASHTIEIMFNLPADSPTGGVQNVPGVLMKQAEQTRGVPLAGLAVKVTPGYFLIGLSALEADMQRNLQLLKERPWFDIPVVYNNNRRAILAMEKGTPGEKVFAEAFAAWKQ
jgi:hypothetical protein